MRIWRCHAGSAAWHGASAPSRASSQRRWFGWPSESHGNLSVVVIVVMEVPHGSSISSIVGVLWHCPIFCWDLSADFPTCCWDICADVPFATIHFEEQKCKSSITLCWEFLYELNQLLRHPLWFGIVHEINHPAVEVPPFCTPIYGNHQLGEWPARIGEIFQRLQRWWPVKVEFGKDVWQQLGFSMWKKQGLVNVPWLGNIGHHLK